MNDEQSMALETVLKFLDCAKRELANNALNAPKLNDKLAILKRERELSDARNVLRKNYYAYCDWCKTGKYEEPTIKVRLI